MAGRHASFDMFANTQCEQTTRKPPMAKSSWGLGLCLGSIAPGGCSLPFIWICPRPIVTCNSGAHASAVVGRCSMPSRRVVWIVRLDGSSVSGTSFDSFLRARATALPMPRRTFDDFAQRLLYCLVLGHDCLFAHFQACQYDVP